MIRAADKFGKKNRDKYPEVDEGKLAANSQIKGEEHFDVNSAEPFLRVSN